MATYTLDDVVSNKKTYKIEDISQNKKTYFMDNRSGLDNFLAGMGKSIYDTGRGIGNLMGFVSDEELKNARELDADLMKSGVGIAGNITGHAAQILLPGAGLSAASKAANGVKALDTAANALLNPQSYKTAAGVGAGYSAIQPALSWKERTVNTIGGGVGGSGGLLAGRLLQGSGQGMLSLVEPLTKGGKQKIVSRHLSSVIGDTSPVVNSLANPIKHVDGSPVTTAEAAMHPSVSGLTRTMRNTDPAFNARMTGIEQVQNNARVNAIESLKQPATKQLRDDMAKAATKRFKGVEVDLSPIRKMVNGMKKQMQMDEYAMKVLSHVEKKLDGEMDLAQLYELRKTLTSDKLTKLDGFDAKTLVNIRNGIDEIAQKQSPIYRAYMDKYKELSKPLNQNAVIDEVMNRAGLPMQNTAEQVMQGANPVQLSPAKMAQALKNDKSLVQKALKFKKAPGMRETLSPEQFKTLRSVNADLTRSSKAQTLGKAIGSNTAQNLAGENMLKRTFGAVLPENLVNHLATGVPGRTANFVYGGSNEAMQEIMSDALTDPAVMREILLLSNARNLPQKMLDSLGLIGYTGGIGVTGGLLSQ